MRTSWRRLCFPLAPEREPRGGALLWALAAPCFGHWRRLALGIGDVGLQGFRCQASAALGFRDAGFQCWALAARRPSAGPPSRGEGWALRASGGLPPETGGRRSRLRRSRGRFPLEMAGSGFVKKALGYRDGISPGCWEAYFDLTQSNTGPFRGSKTGCPA